MTKDEQWLLDEKYHGEATEAFEVDRGRFASGEPLAYVIGSQPFLGLTIYLDSHPLIPRSETEWWVGQVLSDIGMSARRESHSASVREEAIFQQKNTPLSSSELLMSQPKFLDLCAGSGAIGCAALARLPDVQVYFGEIDPAHEATILKNIRENKLDESRASIRIGDLFEPFAGMQFDLVVANPPYIPSSRELDASVVDYEPHQALFAGSDGLDVIRRIATELPRRLTPSGRAWIEVDSTHAEAARKLLEDQGLHASILVDQYERPRVIVVSFPDAPIEPRNTKV